MYFIACMESIDSNSATIGCQPNILQSLPGGYRRRRQICATCICYQSGLYHFFAELFIESPDMNDTTNMCQSFMVSMHPIAIHSQSASLPRNWLFVQQITSMIQKCHGDLCCNSTWRQGWNAFLPPLPKKNIPDKCQATKVGVCRFLRTVN